MANPEHLARLKEGVEAWNAWRRENPGVRVDLQGAIQSWAELAGADFAGADLEGAFFVAANLAGADLTNSILDDASFQQANLAGATLEGARIATDFTDADLFSANLQDAHLVGTNLTRSKIVLADFSRATLVDTTLALADASGMKITDAELLHVNLSSLDLSQVQGLGRVEHHGPSFISTNTLALSRGQTPPTFLRGCGLSDWEIESSKLYNPDLTNDQVIDITYKLAELRGDNPIQFNSAFISYSHKDKKFARKLHDDLQEAGIRCWRDEKHARLGDKIIDMVVHAIRKQDKVLLLCSKDSLTSTWVEDELEAAVEKERKESRPALIPLDLDGYLFDGWENGYAPRLRARLAGDFKGCPEDEQKYQEQFKRLVEALRMEGGQP